MSFNFSNLHSNCYQLGRSAVKGAMNAAGLRKKNPALTSLALERFRNSEAVTQSLDSSSGERSFEEIRPDSVVIDFAEENPDSVLEAQAQTGRVSPVGRLLSWRNKRAVLTRGKSARECRLLQRSSRQSALRSLKSVISHHSSLLKENGYRAGLAAFRMYHQEKYTNMRPLSRLVAHAILPEIDGGKKLILAAEIGTLFNVFLLSAMEYKNPLYLIHTAVFLLIAVKFASSIAHFLETIACYAASDKVKQIRARSLVNPQKIGLWGKLNGVAQSINKVSSISSKMKNFANSTTALVLTAIVCSYLPLMPALKVYLSKIASYSSKEFTQDLAQSDKEFRYSSNPSTGSATSVASSSQSGEQAS